MSRLSSSAVRTIKSKSFHRKHGQKRQGILQVLPTMVDRSGWVFCFKSEQGIQNNVSHFAIRSSSSSTEEKHESVYSVGQWNLLGVIPVWRKKGSQNHSLWSRFMLDLTTVRVYCQCLYRQHTGRLKLTRMMQGSCKTRQSDKEKWYPMKTRAKKRVLSYQPTSSPGSSRFSIWRWLGRRPWHTVVPK